MSACPRSRDAKRYRIRQAMIKLIESLPDRFAPICASSVRIISLFNAYNGYNLALFWAQFDGDTPTALVSSMDGDMTLCATASADLGEVCEFVRAIGARSVLSNLPLPIDNATPVNQLVKTGGIHIDLDQSLKEVYGIMSTSFAMPEFDVWYADMSHRVRHSSSAVACNSASALCAHLTDDASLIVGLCTHPDYRGEGSASTLLNQIISAEAKKIFVLAENQLVKFYVNHGFKPCGLHYLYDGDVF